MFKLGRQKEAAAEEAADRRETAPAPRVQQSQEALAIGGGKAKAAAEAVEIARAELAGLDAARLRSARMETAGGVLSAGPATLAAAAPSQEAGSMNKSSSENVTGQGANGDGAGTTGGAEHGPLPGGSRFTEPTPGGKEKTVATLLGEIVWLFSQSPKHKNFFISNLEWLVMIPILLKQFRVFYAPDRPIGVALWAYVNEEVEQRLTGGNARLAPADWKSGDKLWLVDIVAPYGGHEAMMKDLKENVFPDRQLKMLTMTDSATAINVI